ncbi:hypothetical protein [Methylobacterium marchantiae]|uniref:hypothetical protein n=1 Tax=Methylobacterium marchantiae TaxID=600331 RepID=UPI001EDE17BE
MHDALETAHGDGEFREIAEILFPKMAEMAGRRSEQVKEQAVESEPVIHEDRDPALDILAIRRKHQGREFCNLIGIWQDTGALSTTIRAMGEHQPWDDLGLDHTGEIEVPSGNPRLARDLMVYCTFARNTPVPRHRLQDRNRTKLPDIIHWVLQ